MKLDDCQNLAARIKITPIKKINKIRKRIEYQHPA